MATTRTIGPLHFEDLEPHRFEDLVRQLIYDFKPWRNLEATGRGGGDDGYDVRGWEVIAPEAGGTERDEEEGEVVESEDTTRRWLIQCKREKEIGPKKLKDYLNDISKEEIKGLHGIIMAAACDFSKKARDAFLDTCRDFGIEECYLWGKAEIEDQLFQPKNDHLLFAYFGISLKHRKQSFKTQIRSRTVTKRKVLRHLEKNAKHQLILLRDPSDNDYPFREDNKYPDDCGWVTARYKGTYFDGIKVTWRRFYAYWNDVNDEWDMANIFNHASDMNFDPWYSPEQRDEYLRLDELARNEWEKLDEKHRAWLEITTFLRYDEILEIDETGDEWIKQPHVYTVFRDGRPNFVRYGAKLSVPSIHKEIDGHYREIVPSRELKNPDIKERKVIFSKKLRREVDEK